MSSQQDFDKQQRILGNIREAAWVLEGFVPKYYEMDPATEELVYAYQLVGGMRILNAEQRVRTSLTSETMMYSDDGLANARRHNRWMTVQHGSVHKVHDNDISFIGVFDDGTKQVFHDHRCSGWLVKVQVKEMGIFPFPLTDDPAEMSDYIVGWLGEMGIDLGTDAFRQTMVEAAEFSSKLLQEFKMKAEEEKPDPIIFEEYDSEDGGSVRIAPGAEIPVGAQIGTRRHIRKSDLDGANLDAGTLFEMGIIPVDPKGFSDTSVPEGVQLVEAVSAYPKTGLKGIVGDMDVTAFASSDPFEGDVETTLPSKMLGLDSDKV